MSALDPELAQLLADEPTEGREPWRPRPWWAWTLGCSIAGLSVLIWSGTLLASAQLGTLVRARSCDASPLVGLSLLAVGSLLVGLAARIQQLHERPGRLHWSVQTGATAAVVPTLLLILTVPGLLGCPSAARIAAWGSWGEALVGRSGLMLAAAAAAMVGALVAGALQVRQPPST